jgi:dihydroorotate dehydrogenase (fumarate)
MTDPMELRLRLHWLAILSAQSKLSFALTGGVHTGLDAIKGVMAGAHAIQVVSALLSAGPEYLQVIHDGLVRYMEALHVESLEELRGCMNHAHSKDPSAEERRDYVSILHKWSEGRGAPEGLHVY